MNECKLDYMEWGYVKAPDCPIDPRILHMWWRRVVDHSDLSRGRVVGVLRKMEGADMMTIGYFGQVDRFPPHGEMEKIGPDGMLNQSVVYVDCGGTWLERLDFSQLVVKDQV